jgi:hypothetical protein
MTPMHLDSAHSHVAILSTPRTFGSKPDPAWNVCQVRANGSGHSDSDSDEPSASAVPPGCPSALGCTRTVQAGMHSCSPAVHEAAWVLGGSWAAAGCYRNRPSSLLHLVPVLERTGSAQLSDPDLPDIPIEAHLQPQTRSEGRASSTPDQGGSTTRATAGQVGRRRCDESDRPRCPELRQTVSPLTSPPGPSGRDGSTSHSS